MPPPVRYARSGDLSIAYQVIGQGPLDLIWCIGSYSHLDLLWEDPCFARTFERLGEFARLLVFDKRGMGLSDRADTLYTLEERNRELRGMAVHLTSRLIGLASPGEVVVSSTVRDFVAGSGFTFVDRGTHALKGVPEPRQVFALG